MMKVYLSGGMKSNWRNEIKQFVSAIWIDPCEHGLNIASEYTIWDLAGIRNCDVVFAYLEKDNPSGLGLMLEIGYAKALNKVVILVDAQDNKYMLIGHNTADCYYSEFEDGITVLKSLSKIYKDENG